jgi:hypothetical protein
MMWGLKYLVLAVLTSLLLVGIGAATSADLSSPEATVESYYRGYNSGDVELIGATFLTPHKIERLGLGIPTTYRILEKKMILESHLAILKANDIEIVTLVEKQTLNVSRDPFVTRFWLRKIGTVWKIVGFAAEEE